MAPRLARPPRRWRTCATGTAGGFDLGARYHWAVDLGVEQIQPGRPVDALLIAGEGAFDMRYQRSLRALVRALQAGGALRGAGRA